MQNAEITSTVVNVKSSNSGAVLLVFEDSIEMNATNTTAAGQYSELPTISNICSVCNAKPDFSKRNWIYPQLLI
jgi:hypothetical protein